VNCDPHPPERDRELAKPWLVPRVLVIAHRSPRVHPQQEEKNVMAFHGRRSGISLVGLIYIIIGIFIAWDRGYISTDLLRKVASALLAIFLWFLVLLDVDLHITS
jgi:succinate dehydrogenase hydrophobic anchor subunit